ncbi:MAG: hypothetical protein AAGA67_05970, partial [Cyanobacteria bacterium P01_F01_bin.153]
MEHHFFNEEEWDEIAPLLGPGIRALGKYYSSKKEVSMDQIIEENKDKLPAFVKYKELTGEENTSINSMWHHRRSDFGPLCPKCNKLLRTPRAKFCGLGTNLFGHNPTFIKAAIAAQLNQGIQIGPQ